MSNYKIHFDNGYGYQNPAMYLWNIDDSETGDKYIRPESEDDYGPVFSFTTSDYDFFFKFSDENSSIV